jgi:hypothetical protein
MSAFHSPDMSSHIKAFLIVSDKGRQICCKYYSDEFKSLEARVSIAVILFAFLKQLLLG